MQQYSDVVLVASVPGGPVRAPAAASVQVNITGGAAATLYSDNGITPRANPVIADSSGEYSFYAANGTYDLVISVTGFTTETKTAAVQLFDAAASSGAAGIGFLPSGTGPTYGWATRTVQGKLSDELCVKDVKTSAGVAVAGDGVQDDTTGIQAAIDYAYNNAISTVYFPPGTYKTTTPLYLWGASHYWTTSGVTGGVILRGAGKNATTINKTTNTTPNDGSSYASDDAVILIAPKNKVITDAAYNSQIKGIYVKGTGSGGTKCTWAVYLRGYGAQILVEDCVLDAKRGFHATNSMWLSKFARIDMPCTNYGFRMDASGTSNRLENIFVTGTDTIGYLLAGSYSTAGGLACDSCSGIAYKCIGEWTIDGLGNEVFTGTSAIETSGAGVNLIVHTPYIQPYDNASYIALKVGASSKLFLKGGQIGTETSPIVIDGQFANVGASGVLELADVRVRDTYTIADTLTGAKVVYSGASITTATLTTTGILDQYGIMAVNVPSGTALYIKRTGGGDMMRFSSAGAGSGSSIDVVNVAETDYENLVIFAEDISFQVRTGAGTASNALVLSDGSVSLRRKMYLPTDAGAAQTSTGQYGNVGAPNNANGSNGDYYFRSDGTAAPTATKDHIYFKAAGAWGGIA